MCIIVIVFLLIIGILNMAMVLLRNRYITLRFIPVYVRHMYSIKHYRYGVPLHPFGCSKYMYSVFLSEYHIVAPAEYVLVHVCFSLVTA